MIEEIKNTDIESATAVLPSADCFDEEGNIVKEKYLRTLPDFTKHEIKMSRKKVFKFLDCHPTEIYYRLEIEKTPFGCNFVFTTDNRTEDVYKKFFNELIDCIMSTVVTIKAFDFNVPNNHDSLEIWGINDQDEPVILYLYPYGAGTIEIGDEE